jgi:aspartate/methionine/tyrosine aminotransferase
VEKREDVLVIETSQPVLTAPAGEDGPALSGPQTAFDDLYTTAYAILDDAKTDHDLLKLYKGSHGSPQPHPHVSRFGEHFYRTRRGLLSYITATVGPPGPAKLSHLSDFDHGHQPRVPMRTVFELLADSIRRPDATPGDVLTHMTTRAHKLAAYRGGTSGYDEEALAFAAAHFQQSGVPAAPSQVLIFAGGAKGAFAAFLAALMIHRDHENLRHAGGLMLAPAGYYQSLRLLPPLFGGSIDVVRQMTGTSVRAWLAETAEQPRRCIYIPLVNNANGEVLTAARARAIAHAVLEHNAQRKDRPVYVLADDVYVGSYLGAGVKGRPIASINGEDLGEPGLGQMSDWTLSVVTASKTFALPTARIAFATTTNPWLLQSVAHYRTVLAHGRVPQITELTAAAALCLTPQSWIDDWNRRYQRALADLTHRIDLVNGMVGFDAFQIQPPEGGWFLPLRVSPRLMPGASSGIDACAVLLHIAGVALLPGELFGYRDYGDGFFLRGSLAVGGDILKRVAVALEDAAVQLVSPDGPRLVEQAVKRARQVADIDAILAACKY